MTTTKPGAPLGYDDLRAYFPTPSMRAVALGVKRDTIRVWDEHRATKLRKSSQGRVTLLLALCSVVAAQMLSPRDAGRWMLTAQPALRGRAPVDLLRSLGDAAYEQLRRLVVEDGLSPGSANRGWDADTWRQIESDLDPAAAARIRETYERVLSGAVPKELDIYELV